MMSQVIVVHSYRRGTGKTSLVVNLAAALAASGKRVGVIDAALQSPSVHIPFGVDKSTTSYYLNDFLLGKCAIEQTVQDVTPNLGNSQAGRIILVPANDKYGEYDLIKDVYDLERLASGIESLANSLELEVFLIDTSAGISDDSLFPLAISDTLLVILRPDQQDYQGTAVITDLARTLDIPSVLLVVNNVSKTFDYVDVKKEVEQTYDYEVAAVLPVSEHFLGLVNRKIFVLDSPHNPLTLEISQLANKLLSS